MFRVQRMFSTCSLLMATLCQMVLQAENPESQIIIIENFISPDTSHALMQFYDGEKRELNQHTDNQLVFSSSTHPHIRQLISTISNKIIEVMNHGYGLPDKKYHIDHCALYCRIPGNYCMYHADNTYFFCPVHGQDQTRLRTTCNGNCAGAKFYPNHTAWREYTALLYLNDGFEGGEIVFEDGPSNKLYHKVIPIKANMLVITPNGPNFYHEVYKIRSGKRYSLHFWYTSDPQHTHPHL